MAPPRYHARYDSAPTFAKSVADTRTLTFSSPLTYPVHDLDGDYVDPAGLDFAPHRLDPRIDLEHGRTKIGLAPVAWASPSFGRDPDDYSVYTKSLDLGEPGAPEWHDLPIGVEYYDPGSRVSMQVFAMREQDALPASSLEFSPVHGFYKPIGPAKIRKGSAYHFERARVHRWTVCERGVNPWALTGSVEKSLLSSQVPTPLGKILADKRISVGGVLEPLCEVLQKALSVPRGTSRTVVPLRLKAMPKPFDDEEDADEGAAADDDAGAVGEPSDLDGDDSGDADLTTPGEEAIQEQADDGEAMAHPSVQGIYEASGALTDVIDHLKAIAKQTENPAIHRDLTKYIAMFEKAAAKLKLDGDKHDGALRAMKSGKPPAEDAEDAEGDDETPDDSELDDSDDLDEDEIKKALARDPDDVPTNIPPHYKTAIIQKAVFPRRLTAAELAPEPVKKAPAKPKPKHDPREMAELRDAVLDLTSKLTH